MQATTRWIGDRILSSARFAIFLVAVLALTLSCYAQPALPLTLAEAQRLAIQNNPQFTSASLTAAAAHQVPAQYHSAFEPSLSGSLTGVGADNGSRLAAGGLNNPVVYDRVGSGLSLGQLITDFGRTGNLVGMAKLQAAAQDQATETTRAQILLEASRDYFALLRALSVEKVADQTVTSRQLVADQVSALAQSKLKSALDVSFANVNLADAKLLQVQAQNDVKAAEANLATALGLPGQVGFTLSEEPMPSQLPDRVDDLVAQAIQDRPELKDLRLQQSAADRFAKAEHELYYPSVGVVGTAGFVPTGYSTIPGRYGAIGLNINIPVFNGGLFKARQTEAELKARASTQNINDLQNRVIRDVRVAWLNTNTAYDRMALTQQLLDQAQLALDLSEQRYNLGLSSIVELSQAQLNLTSAQIANVTARYDYQTQRVVTDFQTGALH
jgi:outer membrane protein